MARFSAIAAEDGSDDGRPISKRARTSTSAHSSLASDSESDVALPDYSGSRPSETYDDYGEEEEEEAAAEGEGEEEEEEEEGEAEELEEVPQDQPIRDASAPVTVILSDPDVLDCPICFEPLSPPVYQCENGHVSCKSCCTKMSHKCGTCSWPIGYNRCRAIEKVLESVKITCRNTPHGCKETLSYSKKHDHEKTCFYTPCSCPYASCTHVSLFNSLYTHFGTAHSHACEKFLFNTAFNITMDPYRQHLFLQEKKEKVLFILDQTNASIGSLISIVCVAPTSSKRIFLYDISAKDETSSIRVKTVARNMPKWVSQPQAEKLFLMPKVFIGPTRLIKLEIVIQSAVN